MIRIVEERKSKNYAKGQGSGVLNELVKRLRKKYEELEVIVKPASNDGLSVRRSLDKEGDSHTLRMLCRKPGGLTSKHLHLDGRVNLELMSFW